MRAHGDLPAGRFSKSDGSNVSWEGVVRLAQERGKPPKSPVPRVKQSQVPSGSQLRCEESYCEGGEQGQRVWVLAEFSSF